MTGALGRVSDLRLEQFRLGELSADEAARISRLVTTDAGVRARLDSLAQSDAEIRERYSDDWLARAIAERAGRKPAVVRPRTAGLAPRWVALGGACAVVIAAAIWLPGRISPTDTAESVRIKGDVASLLVYRRTSSGSESIADGDALRRGDLIRVAYRAASPRFGVIVSIDGRKVVTRHLPTDGTRAPALLAGSVTLLDQAYELDDAPKWERFFLVTSETAFDVQVVLDAARRAAARSIDEAPSSLPLPAQFEQSSFLLRKVS